MSIPRVFVRGKEDPTKDPIGFPLVLRKKVVSLSFYPVQQDKTVSVSANDLCRRYVVDDSKLSDYLLDVNYFHYVIACCIDANRMTNKEYAHFLLLIFQVYQNYQIHSFYLQFYLATTIGYSGDNVFEKLLSCYVTKFMKRDAVIQSAISMLNTIPDVKDEQIDSIIMKILEKEVEIKEKEVDDDADDEVSCVDDDDDELLQETIKFEELWGSHDFYSQKRRNVRILSENLAYYRKLRDDNIYYNELCNTAIECCEQSVSNTITIFSSA
jgi:hypothetical protein